MKSIIQKLQSSIDIRSHQISCIQSYVAGVKNSPDTEWNDGYRYALKWQLIDLRKTQILEKRLYGMLLNMQRQEVKHQRMIDKMYSVYSEEN